MTTTLARGAFRFRTAGGRTSGGGLGLRLPPMKALTCGQHVTVRLDARDRVWLVACMPSRFEGENITELDCSFRGGELAF